MFASAASRSIANQHSSINWLPLSRSVAACVVGSWRETTSGAPKSTRVRTGTVESTLSTTSTNGRFEATLGKYVYRPIQNHNSC